MAIQNKTRTETKHGFAYTVSASVLVTGLLLMAFVGAASEPTAASASDRPAATSPH